MFLFYLVLILLPIPIYIYIGNMILFFLIHALASLNADAFHHFHALQIDRAPFVYDVL